MDTNIVETTGFEDVGALIEVYRTELERSGFTNQAEALRGIEVLDRSGAEVALMTVRNMPTTSRNLDVLGRHVDRVLTSALRSAAA
jgi:hypothetical protein